jgi:hypothetical protein
VLLITVVEVASIAATIKRGASGRYGGEEMCTEFCGET